MLSKISQLTFRRILSQINQNVGQLIEMASYAHQIQSPALKVLMFL